MIGLKMIKTFNETLKFVRKNRKSIFCTNNNEPKYFNFTSRNLCPREKKKEKRKIVINKLKPP